MTDIVISFDSTGSMSPAINEVRRKVTELITFFDTIPDLRMAIMNHGSYCDDDRLLSTQDFTRDKNQLIQFLKTTQNTHGCDMRYASYEYVLDQAQYLTWESDTRIFILIGDCEPHPIGYATHRNDIPQDGSRVCTIPWKDRATLLANTFHVKFFPIQALNRSKHTHFYTHLAQLTNSPKLDLMQLQDVLEYITAIIYSQQSTDLVYTYAETLKNTGGFNRNIATMFNTLLRTEAYTTKTQSQYDDTLREVDPSRFQVLFVDSTMPIKEFVIRTGATFRIGRGFYELTKPEIVQEKKEVVLRDKVTGDMFSGNVARDMIHVPYGTRGKVTPQHNFGYDVFIQSTSVNRKLIGNTRFLYEVK